MFEVSVCESPQLEKLKPGSRIVSHEFDMRGAKPVQVYRMSEDDIPYGDYHDEYGYGYEEFYDPPAIYKWIVPWEKDTTKPKGASSPPRDEQRS